MRVYTDKYGDGGYGRGIGNGSGRRYSGLCCNAFEYGHGKSRGYGLGYGYGGDSGYGEGYRYGCGGGYGCGAWQTRIPK
jgi:hypothetical protein